jgi:hypothetical protein
VNRTKEKIGEILIKKGLISREQLKKALEEQVASKEFLGRILFKKDLIKETDLLKALSEQFNIPIASFKDKYIDWNFVKSFSPSLILDHGCFPVERDDSSVTIGITNPLDAWAQDKANEEAKGLKLKLALISFTDMDEVIKRYKLYLRGDILKGFK